MLFYRLDSLGNKTGWDIETELLSGLVFEVAVEHEISEKQKYIK